MNEKYFLEPQNPMQKRYESLRASHIDKLSDKEISDKFGYTLYSFKSLKRDSKAAKPEIFFKELKRGPKDYQKKSLTSRERIIELRKKSYSVPEIAEKLSYEGKSISMTQINKILEKEGFTKLFRRTKRERLEVLQSERNYAEYSDKERFGEKREASTEFGGIFLFLPIIIEMGLEQLFQMDDFYGSKQIPSISYLISYLGLKLLGKERVCHIDDYGFDYGLGVYAGLNVLPKSSSISSYTYRHPGNLIRKMLKGFVKILQKRGYIQGRNINLDFHTIPHYGDNSVLEGHWISTRGKRMKSVLSFFAQDLDTTFLCFSDGEIRNSEMNDEILQFVDFYKETTGLLPERLIFDSKLTTYENLNKLNKSGILFITLKRRGTNFAKQVLNLSNFENVTLDKVDRKYRSLQYVESKIKIKDYEGEIRQIIVKGTGRELPMCLITNDLKSSVKDILTLYSHRWRIENNIQENVDFFNLNALSSSIVVKVDFDIALTLIANTLYKILAQKIKWFERATPKTISRNFIEVKSKIIIKQNEIVVKFSKKNYNPLLMDWINSLNEVRIPWWNNRSLIFEF